MKPSIPTQWASCDGSTSDGSPSFIPNSDVSGEAMKQKLLQENYIKGSYKKNGFFHFETREGTEILKFRVELSLSQVTSNLNSEKFLMCCASKEKIEKYTEQQSILKKCRDVVKERLLAPCPFGATKTSNAGDIEFYSSNGVWLYPPIFDQFKVEKSYDNVSFTE